MGNMRKAYKDCVCATGAEEGPVIILHKEQ